MKIKLELVINDTPDDRVFLNYWDSLHGRDVCTEIKCNAIMLWVHKTDTNGIVSTNEVEITLDRLIKLIKNNASKPQ